MMATYPSGQLGDLHAFIKRTGVFPACEFYRLPELYEEITNDPDPDE
jgi:hypothetical protein